MSRHTFGPPRLLLCVVATTCLGACSGGLERVSSPCPDGQELREERYDATSIKARGCVGRNSENNYSGEGRWEFFYPSGQKKAEGSYADTLHTVVDGFHSEEDDSAGIVIDGREGLWVFWYDNGQKEAERSYRDGKLEGLFTWWHENGQKRLEGTFRDGELEGLATHWYENGQKEAEGSYVDGFQGGERGSTGILIDGREGLWMLWYENGQKEREETYRDGKLEGLATHWYGNGQKEAEGSYVDGNQGGETGSTGILTGRIVQSWTTLVSAYLAVS